MGDPLSIAASAAGLVSLGLQSAEYLYNYYTTYRDQDQDLARIADQLGDLVQCLQVINDVVLTRKWRPDERTIIRTVEKSITRCEDVIQELHGQILKFKKEPTNTLKQKAIVIGRRAAYPFKQSTLVKLGEDVDDFRENLSLALQALQLKDSQDIQNDLEELKQITKSAQAQHVASGVRQWLKAPDATVDYNSACSKRHAKTGQWLIQSSTFTDWLRQDNSFLWLYGFAGCGKSVLHSTTVQSTYRHQQGHDRNVIAFFSFTFSDDSKQDISAALRAILLQLAGQIANFDTELQRLKSRLNEGTPPVQTLIEYLRDAVARCRNVYILLDALDESPEMTKRQEVLSTITTLRGWHLPGLHLLVTSRDTPDIRGDLEVHQNMPNTQWTHLKNGSIDRDIQDYVSHQVDNERELKRWSDAQRQQIKDYLSQHANGVFRWVECQLYPLKKCPRSVKHLERCLRSLPASLDKTYERILCRIGDEAKEEAIRILALLCFSPRPLSISEVIEAIAVDIDDLDCYDEDRKLNGADDLLRFCPGLIEINFAVSKVNNEVKGEAGDSSNDTDEQGDNRDLLADRIVGIGHFSVQEYLVSDRIKKGPAADFALCSSIQHARIFKTCLLYLTNRKFLDQPLTSELVHEYSLSRYAAEYWAVHYRCADKNIVEPLSKTLITSLEEHSVLGRWLQLWNPDTKQEEIEYGDISKIIPPVYYAVRLGLKDIVAMLLDRGADVNAHGGRWGNALQVPSAKGDEKMVELLLNRGADVNIKGGAFGSALQAASYWGHTMTVKMLLASGADVNGQGRFHMSALQIALQYCHKDIAQIFLDSGADVGRGDDFSKSLAWALAHGFEKIAQLLLDRGAGSDPQAFYDETLVSALKGGHEKVVQLLFDRGADVNAQAGELGTALIAASGCIDQRTDLVQLLLDRGADINASAGYDGTALIAASKFGYEKVAQLLLDRGADIHAQVAGGLENALIAASSRGNERTVQLLLDRGADVNAQVGGHFGCALVASIQYGGDDVAQILINRNADVNGRGGPWGSALAAASSLGAISLAQQLLDRGADVNTPLEKYGSALRVACMRGEAKIVELLLDRGAVIDAQGRDHGNALITAIVYGQQDIVRLLIDRGANIHSRGGDYGNALTTSIAYGQVDIVQLLLDKGANVDDQGDCSSALQVALMYGHERVVRLLLERDADVNLAAIDLHTAGQVLVGSSGMFSEAKLGHVFSGVMPKKWLQELLCLATERYLAGGVIQQHLINAGASVQALDTYEWTPELCNGLHQSLKPDIRNLGASSLHSLPAPTEWHLFNNDSCFNLSQDRQEAFDHESASERVVEKGVMICANYFMPADRDTFYFEVTILSTGPEFIVCVGFCHLECSSKRLPGWDSGSWGYHGDDGKIFNQTGEGDEYGPTYRTGDVIGCGVDFAAGSAFFTKNGQHLGIAFTGLTGRLLPACGIREKGTRFRANFGQRPFMYQWT